MPEMNGHELASIIKGRDPRQPIIMITAYADMLADMMPVPEVDLVMGKPWSIDELGKAISKVLPAPGRAGVLESKIVKS
jgi:CheY-like chemotaxis protein